MIWLVLSMIAVIYATGGYVVSKSVKAICDYDFNRSKWANRSRTCSSDVVGPDEDKAFWLGVFWLPIGLLSLGWHLNRVDWSKEERKLMRQLNKDDNKTTLAKLQEQLDNRREERRAKLEAELKQMETENL